MAKNKRAMAIIRKEESNFDKILAYHINPEQFPLSPTLEVIRERWNKVLTLRLKRWTKPQIVKKWKEDYELSPAQAYIDIRNSESLYGNVLKADKEGSRVLWMSWAEDFLQRARKKKDLKAEGIALKLIAEYGDFKEEENPEFNPAKLENREIVFNLPSDQVAILEKMAKSGIHDFNKLNVIDIDYEAVPEDGN